MTLQAMVPLLLLLQGAVPAPARPAPDTVPAERSARAPAPARPAAAPPSIAPGAPAGPRDTVRIEDVSDDTLEWLSFLASALGLLATLYVIILTQRSLRAAVSATEQTIEANKIAREANDEARRSNERAYEQARVANQIATEGLSATLYPQMWEWLGVRRIDGTPYLVLELQNDGPLPASDLRIFVASYLRDDDLSATEFVERYCKQDPWAAEPVHPGPGGEYVVKVSVKHPTLWKSWRLQQPLHLDFGAERCVVILHLAHSHGRYYVQRTRYRRNESPSGEHDLYTSEVDIELTETDATNEQEIIQKGTRGLNVDPALRDLWERHSVDWSRLKDRRLHRSIPREH